MRFTPIFTIALNADVASFVLSVSQEGPSASDRPGHQYFRPTHRKAIFSYTRCVVDQTIAQVLSFATIIIGTINYAVPSGHVSPGFIYGLFWYAMILAESSDN